MDKRELISVVIPNYNGAEFLRKCLDSLLKSTWIPTIIVVDNGSADDSCRMLEEEYPQVLLLRLPVNTGFCHAVNAGLHLVRTPYVFLLNNDTAVDARAVEELYLAMEKRPDCFAMQALMLSMQEPELVDDAGDLYSALGWAFGRGKGESRSRYLDKGKKENLTPVFAACAGAAMYRMQVFDEIGWFDERHYCYLEDIDIGWRAQIYGHRSYLAPKAQVLHAGSATTGSRYNEFKEVMSAGNNALLLYKNMPRLQYWLNAPLWTLGTLVKKEFFRRKGLGEAYRQGLERGKFLKALTGEYTMLRYYEIPYKKGSIGEEGNVPDKDGVLEEVLPLYLGQKIPFSWGHLPAYVSIQGQLYAGLFRRRITR